MQGPALTYQVQETIPTKHNFPQKGLVVSSEWLLWTIRLNCDLFKGTTKVGNHGTASSLWYFVNSSALSTCLHCQLWARSCTTCQGKEMEWDKRWGLEKHVVRKMRSMTTLHFCKCYRGNKQWIHPRGIDISARFWKTNKIVTNRSNETTF